MVRRITTIEELQDVSAAWQGSTIGLVPTMGALHAGHVSLVEAAKKTCDKIIVSIFVNPTQFGENEDFDAYPRVLDEDSALLEAAGIDAVYTPSANIMYPEGFNSSVSVKGVSEGLCGNTRPGHFDGVATVVAKLFQQVQPTHAFFGEKDFQQLQVIKQLCRDLDFLVQIVGCPTLRETDGLAMSSRNRYLNEAERATAPMLYNTLQNTAEAIRAGESSKQALLAAKTALLEYGFNAIDYLSYCDSQALEPLASYTQDRPTRLLVAAFLNKTRLIDNIEV